MTSLTLLLEAAEYLDRREREAEHGYASSHLPSSYDLISGTHAKHKGSKLNVSKKSQGNRTTHNELEKNRRAHLRGCLEQLKELVPLGGESSRHTTLGLLKTAKKFIGTLEKRDREQRSQKLQLIREQRFLVQRLDQLAEEAGITPSQNKTHRSRSISESSSGISSASTSPTSEVGECDLEQADMHEDDADDQEDDDEHFFSLGM